MPSPDKRTISLPAEQASHIDALVASGSYATSSEVVRAGLRAFTIAAERVTILRIFYGGRDFDSASRGD